MTSTFFGLNIASSGLNAFQTAVNTTANNISNVQTEGYSKQVANRVTSDSLKTNQKYGTAGAGVTTTSITQLRNTYYDEKYWKNQSSYSMYETKVNYMSQIETYFIDDDTEQGFSTIFANMFNNLNTLSTSAGDITVRQAFVSSAQKLCSYFSMISTSLSSLQEDCNDQIKAEVDNVNSIAEKIAALNKQINSIEIQGGYANELRDQRALLVDELSKIVPVTAEELPVLNSNDPDTFVGATTYVIKINGQKLVDTYTYNTLECVAREYKVNQTDVAGLYDVKWSNSSSELNLAANTMTGTLKALVDIRDGNNGDGFKGKVINAGPDYITVRPSTMTTLESLTINDSGYVTIKARDYKYNDITINYDADGNVESYTFNLAADSPQAGNSLSGLTATVGDNVEAMGIPYYMGQMTEYLRTLCELFNAYQKSGQDMNGNAMGAFFVASAYDGTEYDFSDQNVSTDGVTYDPSGTSFSISSKADSYYKLNVSNLGIAEATLRDASVFATTTDITQGVDAHDIVDQMMKLQSTTVVYRGNTADQFLQCILSDITVDAQESEIFYDNYKAISETINFQRMSISGVDNDEEALDLIKFQNAYGLASKTIQVLSEMYDRLILETGV
ncbi:MAG: flagellar hook-associated protein FlgK [Lachnospiraceae bacterium]|nr:flagellar hook-associated protein FlgK [Lachnospiraceae bacterium]